MTVEIYYFSATGNSYRIAELLSKKLDATLLPLISITREENIKSKADVIGLVFPIYDFKVPEMINVFFSRLQTERNPYFFAVCTYGVMPLNTMKKLNAEMGKTGRYLSSGFAIKMPHNGIGYDSISFEKQQEMFKKSEQKCDEIVSYVTARKQGFIETSSVLDRLKLAGILARMLPKLIPMLARALVKGWDSLGFYADESCDSCGVCAKVCPVENIDMKDIRPMWNDHCIGCFACIHWCPKESIQIANLTKNMQRYHHPEVSMQDILKQKQN